MKFFLPWVLAVGIISQISDAKDETARTFQVLGVVKKLKPEIRTAVIDHEEIPGYMDAMTMSLEVRDIAEFNGIKAGDKIAFRMNVTEDDGWIDQLKLVSAARTSDEPAAAPSPLIPIAAGENLPDAELVDEQGQPFKLSDHQGQAIAVTFIYTRCPFPTFCPRINTHFREAQTFLKNDPAAPKNWRLLSITIDPGHDTPEVLSSFAKTQGADPSHWKFATGTLRNITRLTVQSGLNFWDDRGLIQHNLRTLVADPSGRVTKVFAEDELSSKALSEELIKAAKKETCACSEKIP
ncbi:SCO family protein [Luteolibacter yonseiensis]|uniref:SCO family protein n=1 Tax=Luteolibacter yonseiensis TaxID=1144680 RepID=A0A934VD22_9BACT|nr:SCO family protein [Luteolibacter yonseiensis]MBK1817715.1 SCO family protein [Luteolibacter yonseiensis]